MRGLRVFAGFLTPLRVRENVIPRFGLRISKYRGRTDNKPRKRQQSMQTRAMSKIPSRLLQGAATVATE